MLLYGQLSVCRVQSDEDASTQENILYKFYYLILIPPVYEYITKFVALSERDMLLWSFLGIDHDNLRL